MRNPEKNRTGPVLDDSLAKNRILPPRDEPLAKDRTDPEQDEPLAREFSRDLQSLGSIFDMVKQFSAMHMLSDEVAFALQLCMEELFTNIVKYRRKNRNKIKIVLHYRDNAVSISMIERDVEPFDITKYGVYDSTASLDQRPVGGLGIHLIRKYMDNVEYDYENRESRVKMTKIVEAGDA